ncbi:hypothetical protein BaRGS_00038547 [Batillaria attramentaria]|uniref:Uncharacterized protein n=1 Tax=Batillaria attramentaria TaxID=370345 RepID=A0ABD0J5J1_9CAEN
MYVKTWLIAFYSFISMEVADSEPCTNFTFSSLNNRTLTAHEETTINLPFALGNTSCAPDFYMIFIEKKANLSFPRCVILHNNHSCSVIGAFPAECSCSAESKENWFNHTVDRSDSGVWIWSAKSHKGEVIAEEEILFDIECKCSKVKQTYCTYSGMHVITCVRGSSCSN